jgi:hypothetical protein
MEPPNRNSTLYYGVTVRFFCPRCKLTSAEKMGLVSTVDNREAINEAVRRQRLFCQFCKQVPPDGTQVDVRTEPGTLERLQKLGFEFPRDN